MKKNWKKSLVKAFYMITIVFLGCWGVAKLLYKPPELYNILEIKQYEFDLELAREHGPVKGVAHNRLKSQLRKLIMADPESPLSSAKVMEDYFVIFYDERGVYAHYRFKVGNKAYSCRIENLEDIEEVLKSQNLEFSLNKEEGIIEIILEGI